jgi:ankyrin repeat protein
MSEVNEEKVITLVDQLKKSQHWTNMNDNRWKQVATKIALGGTILTGEQCKKIYGKRNKKNSKKKAKKQRAVPPAETGLTEGTMDADVASSQLLLTVEQISFPPASNGMWPTGDKVKALLKVKGIDVNVRDKNGRTPLYQACLNRDTWIVRLLLAVPNIDVNLSCPSDGTTPLHVACKSDSGIVEQLLRNEHINVNLLTTKGLTALYVACEYGVPSNVQHLVEAAGILVNQTQSANGWTPLMAACEKGDKNAQSDHSSCIEILLGAPGIDVNQPLTSGATALYIACLRKHLEAIHLLLLAPNIDINKAKKNGKTPLFVACYKGNSGAVKALLQYTLFLDVNKATKDGETPLYIACKKGNWDIVVLLLMFDEIQVDEAAWAIIINVMQYPVTRQNEIANIIENKLDEDEDENLKMLLVFGPYNRSFFYKACNQNLPKIVTALSAREDVNVNQPFDRPHGTGTTPLTEAIPSLELVRILLKCKGINVNKEDRLGWTPLIKACMANSIDIVQELLQTRDIRVNLKSTDSGDTALHYACGAPPASTEIISMLLERREIKVNEPSDQGGKTPLIMAIMSGQLDKVKLLMERREINMSETRGDNTVRSDNTVRMKTPLFWAFDAVDEYGMQSLQNFEVLNFMMGMIKKYPRLMSDLPYFLNRSILKFCSANGDMMNYIDSNFYALAKSILEYPIGLNYYSEQETPLTAVCKHVNVDSVSHIKLCAQFVALLLSNPKVDINKKTMGDPESALHIACRRGLLPIVEMLVARRDVKVNDSNVWGATALFLACNTVTRSEDISPASLGIVQSLLTRTDIRINKSVKMTRFNDVKSSWTPLHEACSNPRKLNLVKLLLSDSRIDIDIRTSTGNTALHMAVLCNSYDIVRVLIGYFEDNNSHKKRGRINQANNTGHNAIDLAVQKDFTNIGVLLAENGGVQSLPQAMQQQLKKRALTTSAIGNTIRRKVQRPVDADGRIATKIVSMLGNSSRKRSTLIF